MSDARSTTRAGARVLSAGMSLLVCFTGVFACESDANDCTLLATCEATSPSDGGSTSADAGAGGDPERGGGAGGQIAETGGEAGSDGRSGADAGGAGGAGGAGESCDASRSPVEDTCVLDEEFGVFVSPDGDDEDGDGSRARPFKTIAAGIVASLERGRRVYACADGGAYVEALEVDALASGLELYGGLSCADFSYTGEKTLVTSTHRPALLVVKDVDGFRAEDLAFVAGEAEEVGASSIGAFVANSSGVEFRRVRFEAGRGANGSNPARPDVSFPATSALSGRPAAGENGGDERVCECPGGAISTGGAGGDAETLGQAGEDGLPDLGAGEGGPAETCDLERARGADAPVLEPAPGAPVWGTLAASGWTPAAGSSGAAGEPGQGGGGGGAITITSNPSVLAGGGGGGCGGCGGVGGPGGGGGGASIALAVFESSVSLERSELVAADAGNGGEGKMGQLAQLTSGKGGSSVNGCAGGDGGLGASGAAGGGGAGGVSAGLIFSGERPTLDLLTAVALGVSGASGKGGEPGVNDGIAGVARAVLDLTPEVTDP